MTDNLDRLDSAMTPDDRGMPYSTTEAEALARDTPDPYIRAIIHFLLRRIERLERIGEQLTTPVSDNPNT